MFSSKKDNSEKPQSYKPVLEAPEVMDLFNRTTLHQQAALLRLMSRNVEYELDGKSYMGIELDYEVENAIIKVSEALD